MGGKVTRKQMVDFNGGRKWERRTCEDEVLLRWWRGKKKELVGEVGSEKGKRG